MFHRDVYEALGGFDESLDVLEDWDLWVKYGAQFDFYTVNKTCSIYKVPSEPHLQNLRRAQFETAYSVVQKKQTQYVMKISPLKLYEIHKNLEK